MGIFKKLIDKVLDAEVPPAIEKLVREKYAKKQAKEKPQNKKVRIVPEIGKAVYTERYIPDDSEEAKQIREAEQRRRNAILSDMIPQIENSPYFKPEKKQILIDMLKKTSKLHDPFSYDDCLTATEEKALGLNSRLKVSRQMIDLLNDEGLKLENPKEIIDVIYHAVCSKQSALENQKRMQETGLKFYVWETSGDERVCAACKIMDQKLCRWNDAAVYSQDGGKTWKPRPKGAILMHPGHHEGFPGRYENCRCTAIAYYPELVGEL